MPKKYTGYAVYKIGGHNKYRGSFTYKGRKYYKYFDGTKKEALEQCRLWKDFSLSKLKTRPFDGSKTWTFFKQEFLTHLRTAKNKRTAAPLFRPRTIEEYVFSFNRVEALLKPHYLNDFDIAKLRQLRNLLEAEAVKKQTDNYGANKVLRCLKVALSWGIDKGYVPDMSINVISLLETQEVIVNTFTTLEIDLFLKYAEPKWRIALLFGADCGCRPEEVYNMLISKIDLKEGFAEISPNKETKNTSAWTPKRGKSRPIRLSPRLCAELKNFKPAGQYIITDKYGQQYGDKTFSSGFKAYLKIVNRAIVENEQEPIKINGSFKLLRKTYATNLQAAGATAEQVALALGHADTAVTKKNYTDAQNKTLQQKLLQEAKQNLLSLDKFSN